jgi:asparagine synthetase B (glutamine-hydrolysing)
VSAVRVVGPLDPNFAWDGERLYDDREFRVDSRVPRELRGAAAAVVGDGEGPWRILRDPLGLNKLFWAEFAEDLLFAARPLRLIEAGCGFEDIRAVPRGCVFDFSRRQPQPMEHSLRPDSWFSSERAPQQSVEMTAGRIRTAIRAYMAAIATRYPAARAFVCLSGGLDSSGIATLAREHFSGLVAVSFDLDRGRGGVSEDRRTAERLARDLGMMFLDATVSEDTLLEALDLVLVEGIDWRDFNVHAALVNAALAAAIEKAAGQRVGGSPVIVLTGDLANEFLVDYQPETYRGVTYYDLPKIEPAALRRILIHGLDSCHREVGVFAAWGLHVVQPYAVAVDSYLALPEAFLRLADRKQRLSRMIFGPLIPDYVYSRTKVRAQVGSSEPDSGVLAACADRGIHTTSLRRRFAELHRVRDASRLDRFIRGSRYRAAAPRFSRCET